MKDISHDEYMDGRLQDPVFAAEYVNAALEDGDCAAVALAMTRVLKARSKSVTVPPETCSG
jgi:DNA-binding phage protein